MANWASAASQRRKCDYMWWDPGWESGSPAKKQREEIMSKLPRIPDVLMKIGDWTKEPPNVFQEWVIWTIDSGSKTANGCEVCYNLCWTFSTSHDSWPEMDEHQWCIFRGDGSRDRPYTTITSGDPEAVLLDFLAGKLEGRL